MAPTKQSVRISSADDDGKRLRRVIQSKRGRIARSAVAVSLGAYIAGCATMQQTFGGWFGAATPTPAPGVKAGATERRVYFAGTTGMKVYSDPSTSSKVLGELALHEKVVRTKTDRGFAYVESAKGGLKGWVNNSQLIWRLPATGTTAAPAPGEAPPEEPAAAPEAPQEETPAVEPTATATNTVVPAAPKPKATPAGVGPSIFNPY